MTDPSLFTAASPADSLAPFPADDLDDDILLTDDDDDFAHHHDAWKILVVDDEPDVYAMTALILGEAVFQGRPMRFLAAHSAEEARAILSQHDDIAVALLDVVMEEDHAGLDLARWIRETLGNREVRIILRTGQPGQAPQRDVIVAYEINDYKSKAELSAEGLFTAVITALRSYDHIRSIETRVSERTRELLTSREQMRAMLESSPVGVCAFDEAGRVVFANQRLGAMLGLSAARLKGVGFAEMMAVEEAETYADRWVQGRQQLRDAEVQFRRADGSDFWGLLSGDPAVMDGQSVYLVWIYDITRRKQAEEQVVLARDLAEAAAAAKSAFLTTMTHEIRTPMNGVLGMLELLERTRLDARQSDTVATIRDSARALLSIIDDVLDYSKIEAGRMELEHVPVSLAAVVEGVSEMLAPGARAKGLDLLTFIDPAIPRSLYADPVRLRQILFNLAGNAVKFTECGGVVVRADLVARHDGWAQVAFEVIDTGIGIAPAALERLFAPFTQAESSITRRFGGTGLGLSISRRLAQLMDGEISVDSAPGAGSTFRLVAPFGIAPVAPVDMSGRVVPPDPDLTGLRVLIASPLNQESAFLADYIAAAGAAHEVAVAANQVAGACLAAAAAGAPFHVLVMAEEVYAAAVAQAPAVLGRRVGEPQPSVALLADPGSEYAAGLTAGAAPGLTLVTRPARRGALLTAVANLAGRFAPAPCAPAFAPFQPIAPTPVCGPASVSGAHEPRERVLVVDDNKINVKVVTMQLELLGYATDSAPNGKAALTLFAQGAYAAVLTDIQMPEMDGFELARRIRVMETGNPVRTPIIAVTAAPPDGAACLGGDFDGWLGKPLSLERLAGFFTDRSGVVTPAPVVKEAVAVDPAAGPSEVVSLKALFALCGDDRAMVKDMLTDFAVASKEVLSAMHDAVAADDRLAIKAAAHNLRGSSRTAGAQPLAEAAYAMERAVSAGARPDDLAELLGRLDVTVSELLDFVSDF